MVYSQHLDSACIVAYTQDAKNIIIPNSTLITFSQIMNQSLSH